MSIVAIVCPSQTKISRFQKFNSGCKIPKKLTQVASGTWTTNFLRLSSFNSNLPKWQRYSKQHDARYFWKYCCQIMLFCFLLSFVVVCVFVASSSLSYTCSFSKIKIFYLSVKVQQERCSQHQRGKSNRRRNSPGPEEEKITWIFSKRNLKTLK